MLLLVGNRVGDVTVKESEEYILLPKSEYDIGCKDSVVVADEHITVPRLNGDVAKQI